MGSTFIGFHEQGFEASDSAMEVWLVLLVKEIDKIDPMPDWLREVRDDWYLQATAGFGYGVMPDLDRYITTDERRDTVLELCLRAEETLKEYGEIISYETLNAFKTGGEGAIYTKDVPSDIYLQTARYFIKLLEGELLPGESDARFDDSIAE